MDKTPPPKPSSPTARFNYEQRSLLIRMKTRPAHVIRPTGREALLQMKELGLCTISETVDFEGGLIGTITRKGSAIDPDEK